MMAEVEMADDIWYVPGQGSAMAPGPAPIMFANDVYLNNHNHANPRPISTDSPIAPTPPSDLASIIADRQRDVLQRMANKAERARRSRKKRKAYVSDLEYQAQTLAEQLRSLSAQEIHLSNRVEELSRENRLVTRHMEIERSIEDGLDVLRSEQEQLLTSIQSWTCETGTADHSESLSSLIEKLLRNSRSISASYDAYLKLAKSTMEFGRGQPSEALWTLLTLNPHSSELLRALDLTDEQQRKLSFFQSRFTLLKGELNAVSSMLEEYRLSCENMLRARDNEIESVIAIIGPENCSKILSWVQKQTWCMELLNSLFPRYIASSLQQEIISS